MSVRVGSPARKKRDSLAAGNVRSLNKLRWVKEPRTLSPVLLPYFAETPGDTPWTQSQSRKMKVKRLDLLLLDNIVESRKRHEDRGMSFLITLWRKLVIRLRLRPGNVNIISTVPNAILILTDAGCDGGICKGVVELFNALSAIGLGLDTAGTGAEPAPILVPDVLLRRERVSLSLSEPDGVVGRAIPGEWNYVAGQSMRADHLPPLLGGDSVVVVGERL